MARMYLGCMETAANTQGLKTKWLLWDGRFSFLMSLQGLRALPSTQSQLAPFPLLSAV